jgi:TRAP-type C4-dicarboxylate transport system permease small subunit
MRVVLSVVERVLDKILIVLFLVMVVAIVWQVFARYVLGAPTIWSEELARFMLVWVTMLGSAYVLEHGGHVAVTVFVNSCATGSSSRWRAPSPISATASPLPACVEPRPASIFP